MFEILAVRVIELAKVGFEFVIFAGLGIGLIGFVELVVLDLEVGIVDIANLMFILPMVECYWLMIVEYFELVDLFEFEGQYFVQLHMYL